jgi:GcrA cell cycle regulator
VIGKANRIGIKLNGGRGGYHARRDAGSYAESAIRVPVPPCAGARRAKLRPALAAAPERQAAWSFAEAEVGDMRRVGFEEIHESICRWPLGDPMSGDFAYCGLKSANGRPYCAGHCRMAYQPPKAGAAEAKRSWRAWRRSFALAGPERLSSS